MTGPIPAPRDAADRLDRLRLLRTENIGPVTFRHLILRYGNAAAALDVLPEIAQRAGRRRGIRICPRSDAEAEVERLERLDARPLHLGENAYPEPLAAIEDAPPVLTIRGDSGLLQKPTVAVVGARNASANGRTLAAGLSRGLSSGGFVVASGLARGIDAAAHSGALDGGTVAVLAGGVDNVYPRENAALYDAIWNRGAIVSEMPPGTEPQARHFPRRNRIISGLSLGVVVIEAAERSGSLTTARFALEQGREVFAVPGSPLDPRSRGTNRLIREGATLVEGHEHVLEELGIGTAQRIRRVSEVVGPGFGHADERDLTDDDMARARDSILSLMGPSPTPIDDIVRLSGLPAAVVRSALLELEIVGEIDRSTGNSAVLKA